MIRECLRHLKIKYIEENIIQEQAIIDEDIAGEEEAIDYEQDYISECRDDIMESEKQIKVFKLNINKLAKKKKDTQRHFETLAELKKLIKGKK